MKIEFPKSSNINQNVPLSEYTKIKIGGTADYIVTVESESAFEEILQFCMQHKRRYLVLGHGSNVFFHDNGFHGIVIINHVENVAVLSETIVRATSGTALKNVVDVCTQSSMTGFEFAAGIPGTVGGAIFGNAGAYGKNVGARLVRATLMQPSGKIETVGPDYFQFAYRDSYLKRHPAIVLDADFQLAVGNPAAIKARIDEILEMRHQKLPPDDWATAGSYFKNIKTDPDHPLPAAKLLDAVGSKQTSVGGVAVYEKHANIFYNKGHATAKDLLALQTLLAARVEHKFAIRLEREVMFFGP